MSGWPSRSGADFAFRTAEPVMDSSIRSTLWGAFAVLVILIAAGLALTIGILHLANRQENRIVEGSAPLLDAVYAMNDDTIIMMSAARGFALSGQTQFLQQYDEAVRDFKKSAANADQLAIDSGDKQRISSMRRNFIDIQQLTHRQMDAARDGHDLNANEFMSE